MAYIEKTAFEPRITNNEFNELCNITGRYQVSDADADCSALAMVKMVFAPMAVLRFPSPKR